MPSSRVIARIARRPLFVTALAVAVVTFLLAFSRYAHRPINPPLTQVQAGNEHRFEGLERWSRGKHEDLVILAFSGGGTRAAAFAYGVLETLRDVRVATSGGRTIRLLDEVDVITGVSG